MGSLAGRQTLNPKRHWPGRRTAINLREERTKRMMPFSRIYKGRVELTLSRTSCRLNPRTSPAAAVTQMETLFRQDKRAQRLAFWFWESGDYQIVESDHFLEILEKLEILETLEVPPVPDEK